MKLIPDEFRQDFEKTLLTGGYNLLLGSGISLDSHNGSGLNIKSSDALRRSLCALKGVPDSTSLTRVAGLLTEDDILSNLIQPFQNCQPHDSLFPLTSFLWRRMFTLNIDDVIEKLYENPEAKQTLSSINYDAPLEPTPDREELQIIHLHGWVGKSNSRFVFSRNEYAQVMRALNPWMYLLSEILATESFIVGGTSLDEPDLEYYLSKRSHVTPRRSRGPSLLVEPFANAATRADCERHGLILVESTFGEFLAWLRKEYPLPPSVSELIIPQTVKLFGPNISPAQALRFYNDFRAVAAVQEPLPESPSRFLDGREPDWDDINSHIDIERSDNAAVSMAVDKSFADSSRPKLILLIDDAGTGKTTVIKRVVHSAVLAGRIALTVSTNSRIDVKNAIECLAEAVAPVLLLADGLADHAAQIAEILESKEIKVRLVVLASERNYRMNYVNIYLGHIRKDERSCIAFTQSELLQVIERYRQYGLLAETEGLRDPKALARRIQSDPIAVVACRLLNDYQPLHNIVESLWKAADEDDRTTYLCAALAHYCYSQGIRYSTLQSVSGQGYSISALFRTDRPLRLAENAVDDDFVIPLNSIIGERILRYADTNATALLQLVFRRLAVALAPHVNRGTVMRRTAESRLAGRLFDADKVVRPLLGWFAEQFYIDVAKDWEWNSRYWEQRALLILETRPHDALHYARHAIAIERHPHSLTTLSKVLIDLMAAGPSTRAGYFAEAFGYLSEAITSEARRSRVTIHPYSTMFSGVVRFLQTGALLNSEQRSRLLTHLTGSADEFPHDLALASQVRQVRELL